MSGREQAPYLTGICTEHKLSKLMQESYQQIAVHAVEAHDTQSGAPSME